VDGQQRIAAIRDARIGPFPVCVVAFITDDDQEQREQFILVNSTKPLPKGLIYELLPTTRARLPSLLQQRRFPAYLLDRLNHDEGSPLRGLIRTPTVVDGLIKDNSVLKMPGPNARRQLFARPRRRGTIWEQGRLAGSGPSGCRCTMSGPAFRMLRPDQAPGASTLQPGSVVRDRATIVQVIGNALTAQGSHTSPMAGFYAFLRGGRRRGGAGFQGVTKDPLARLGVVIANVGQSQGSVAAAIDLAAVNPTNVFDLADASLWQQLVTAHPQNQAFFTRLRAEGVTGVMGSIPATAVAAVVLLPGDPTARDAALVALLS
jgi:hypothetical protein